MTWGACILDAEGLRLTGAEKALFAAADPFGFILFARNIDTADQVRALCDDFRQAVGRDLPITIDQEGGRVQRLRPPLARNWFPPLEHATRAGAGAGAEQAMYLRYRLIADELRGLGIDSNCAPTLDLARPETHSFLKNRCFGDSVTQVVQLGRAAAQGMLDGGVLPVMKHMPGHGRATQDTHHDLPHVTADPATLEASDFAVFRALRDLPMGMTAHLVFDAYDTAPATISAPMVRVIRDTLGFEGLLMSDDISMQALSGTPATRAAATRAAGVDIALYCNGPLAERAAVAEVAGRLDGAGQARAEAALAYRKPPEDIDIPAAEAELSSLMGGQVYDG